MSTEQQTEQSGGLQPVNAPEDVAAYVHSRMMPAFNNVIKQVSKKGAERVLRALVSMDNVPTDPLDTSEAALFNICNELVTTKTIMYLYGYNKLIEENKAKANAEEQKENQDV